MSKVINNPHQANTPAIVTSAGDVLSANTSRQGWSIQNVGQNPIFIRFATGASITVFHHVIKGGTGDSDGLGGSIGHMEGSVYSGVISIAGTTPKLVVTEL